MSETPTPETDAAVICRDHASFKSVGGVVVAQFARQLERERDEAREAFATATNHAIEAREMLRRIMDWSPCLPEYEPDAQHLKWQSDAHAARKFLEAAK